MAKSVVDRMTISKKSRSKARVALTFTTHDGLYVAVKSKPAGAPTEDMIAMASALAIYLCTGKKPARWSGP